MRSEIAQAVNPLKPRYPPPPPPHTHTRTPVITLSISSALAAHHLTRAAHTRSHTKSLKWPHAAHETRRRGVDPSQICTSRIQCRCLRAPAHTHTPTHTQLLHEKTSFFRGGEADFLETASHVTRLAFLRLLSCDKLKDLLLWTSVLPAGARPH